MKYALAVVEVKLVQMPDDHEPIEPPRPGDDPMQIMGAVATKMFNAPVLRPNMFMGNPAGFDFRKEISVSCHSFNELAEIIGKFDTLVSDIEIGKLAHQD